MQRYRNGQEHAARNLFPIPIGKLGQNHFAILKIDNAPPTFRARRREALKLSNSTDSFGSKIHQSCSPNPAPLGRDLSAADFSPQGGCGIRKAAKPLTAAQAVRRRQIILIRFLPRSPSRHYDSRARWACQSCRFLETGSLHPPLAALRQFPCAWQKTPLSLQVCERKRVRAAGCPPLQNDGSAIVLKFYFPNGQIG